MIFEKHPLAELKDLAVLGQSTYSIGEIVFEDYLYWEYLQNPIGKAIVYVAKKDTIVVAQYVILPKNILVDDKVVSVNISVNTITHPDYRGHGLFPKLAELAYDDCLKSNQNYTIGFPNSNSTKGFLDKLKFADVGKLPLLLNVKNPLFALFVFLMGRRVKGETEIDLNFITEDSSLSNLDFEKDKTQYSSFWLNFKKRNVITTDRSMEYLKWRYVDVPFRKYRVLKFVSNNEIKAIIVLRAKKIFGIRCGIIVDFLCSTKNEHLLDPIFGIFKRNKLALIIATCSRNSLEYQCLRRAGFFKVPDWLMFKKLTFIIRDHLKNSSNNLIDFKKWFITFGDYDIF